MPPPSRLLLCASAAHCAQVLQAAAHANVHLHGLTPCTLWPTEQDGTSLVFWALLPPGQCDRNQAIEQQWRSTMLHGSQNFTVHMLYGTATQQAQQLAPWVRRPSESTNATADSDCWECLDARSEQAIFTHLLAQRT